MSVTTLEEVFIKVAQGTSTNAEAEAGRQKKSKRYSYNLYSLTPTLDLSY